jgi:hypothetical protein
LFIRACAGVREQKPLPFARIATAEITRRNGVGSGLLAAMKAWSSRSSASTMRRTQRRTPVHEADTGVKAT